MNEIENLLTAKETARQQLRRQIEALRRSAALLAEPTARQAAANAELPAIVAAAAEPALRTEARAEAVVMAEPLSAARAGIPNYVRFTAGTQVFPPVNEGM